jgi:hypothetical protein
MPQSRLPDFSVALVFMATVHQKSNARRCISYTWFTESPDSVRCMVTAKTQYNLKNAREYLEEHLCVGDYYDECQRVYGDWLGMGAGQLESYGKVQLSDDENDPLTKLTSLV